MSSQDLRRRVCKRARLSQRDEASRTGLQQDMADDLMKSPEINNSNIESAVLQANMQLPYDRKRKNEAKVEIEERDKVGQILKAARKARRLSAMKLGNMIGLTHNTILNAEKNLRRVKAENILAIAKELNQDISRYVVEKVVTEEIVFKESLMTSDELLEICKQQRLLQNSIKI